MKEFKKYQTDDKYKGMVEYEWNEIKTKKDVLKQKREAAESEKYTREQEKLRRERAR